MAFFTLRAMQSGLSNVLNKLETNPVHGARKALFHEERNECERREESKYDAQDNESGGFKSNNPNQVTASRRSKVEQGDEWR